MQILGRSVLTVSTIAPSYCPVLLAFYLCHLFLFNTGLPHPFNFYYVDSSISFPSLTILLQLFAIISLHLLSHRTMLLMYITDLYAIYNDRMSMYVNVAHELTISPNSYDGRCVDSVNELTFLTGTVFYHQNKILRI